MSDIVVTVPKNFRYPPAPGTKGLAAWIAEGDAAGTEWSGAEWAYSLGGPRPPVEPGERVYIVCEERLRGYAPLIRLEGWTGCSPRAGDLIRGGGAVAVTIPEKIRGFRGYRLRWWKREDEVPFPGWMADAEPKPRSCKCGALLKDGERRCAKCKGKTKQRRRDRIAEFFARPECEDVYLSFLDWWQVMVKDGLAVHEEWPAPFCWQIWHFCEHEMWAADPAPRHGCMTDALRRRLNASVGWSSGDGPILLDRLFDKKQLKAKPGQKPQKRYKILDYYNPALKAYRDAERAKAQEEAARRRNRPRAQSAEEQGDLVDGQWVVHKTERWKGILRLSHHARRAHGVRRIRSYRTVCKEAPADAWVYLTEEAPPLRQLRALTEEEEADRDAWLKKHNGHVYESMEPEDITRWKKEARSEAVLPG